MRSVKIPLLLRGSLVTGVLAALSCISPQSPLTQAAKDCPEFGTEASAQSAKIDQTVKVFMQASAEFSVIAHDMKGAVKTACINVAKDLGAQDTWSGIGDADSSIHNDQNTGACDQAAAKIRAIMESVTSVNGKFALNIERGTCHCDFERQKTCDISCDTEHSCTPGTTETRCEPGEVSFVCDTACSASSVCEGTRTRSCNCSGRCEATCMGQCEGACIHDDGSVTMNDQSCHGRCSATCRGSCTGRCRVTETAGISCGSEVRCKGSCTGTSRDPVCETTFRPPDCTTNTSCHESCRAEVAAHPICDPTKVSLVADINARGNADVKKLIDTINKNLPPVIESAEIKGKIAVQAIAKLSETGQKVLDASGNLDGHSLACAKAASKASADAGSTINIVSQASVNVTNTTQERAQWGGDISASM